MDEALTRLSEEAPETAEVVKLRYFAGLTIEETAEVLGMSISTVKRQWRYARAWLRSRLQSGAFPDGSDEQADAS